MYADAADPSAAGKIITSMLKDPLIRLAAIVAACIGSAGAQEPSDPDMGEAVVAVVNDQMISTFDVRQRLRLMLIARGEVPPQVMPQFRAQAVRDLIDERVKLQEAAKFDLTVSDASINEELAAMAAGSGLAPDDLADALAADGISIEALKDQIRADIAWRRLVSGRFRERVRVSEAEVDAVLNRLREATMKERYAVSEICLAYDSPDDAERMRAAGEQIIEALRIGANFGSIAQQFSACPSAASGGDLGVVLPGQLPEAFDAALARLDAGEVSAPIEGEGEFRIFAMRERLPAEQRSDPEYDLVHIFAPLSLGEARARSLVRETVSRGCAEALASRSGPDSLVDGARLDDLPDDKVAAPFRERLFGKLAGEHTDVVVMDGAAHALAVCAIDEGLGLPSREQIENQLFSQQLEMFGRRYLRDIKRKAAIEDRLADG